MQNARPAGKSPEGCDVAVNIIYERACVAVTFDHHLEKWLAFLPELANPALGFAFSHQIQDEIVGMGIQINQKIEWCVSELKRACRGNVTPE